MKKNYYVTKRLVSLALAVVLSSGSLFATAMAATVTVGATGTSAATANKDVFYFDATSVSAGAATVTDFNVAQDYISVKLPSGFSLGKTVSGANTQISMTKDGAVTNLFIVNDTTPDKVNMVDPAQPVIFGVTVGGVTTNSIDKGGKITLTPTVTLASGGEVANPTYTVTSSGAPLTAGVTTANGVTTIDTKDIAAGTYTYTLTATVGGKSGSYTISAITINNTCTPTFVGVINFATTNTASVQGNAVASIALSGGAANITSNNCTYGSAHNPNHGKSPTSVAYSLENEVTGVTITGTNLAIDGSKLTIGETNVTVVASITVDGTPLTAKQALKITKTAPTTIPCTVTGVVVAQPKDSKLGVAAGSNAVAHTYTATVTAAGASCTVHSDGNHGLEWSLDGSYPNNWATINSSTGALTINEAQMPSGSNKETVTVKATVGDSTKKLTHAVTTAVERPVRCTLAVVKIDDIGKVSIPDKTTPPGQNSVTTTTSNNVTTVKLLVKDTTAILNVTLGENQGTNMPRFTGSCEYKTASNEAACPSIANHKIIWSLEKAVNGVSIDPNTGVLTVNRKGLSAVESNVIIVAKVSGPVTRSTTVSAQGYVVVRNELYSSDHTNTGGNNNSDYEEQSKNSQQWDKLEYKIEDADSKDNIKVSMGDNTNMPTRIVRELVGKNVTVEISVTGGYTWILNGKNLKKPPTYQIGIGMGVKTVKDKDATSLAKGNAIKVLELEHNGTFYGTYTLEQRVDTDYRNKYLYLYKYDDDANKLYYRGSAKVDDDGYVKFPFTSASTYVMTDKALYGEKAGSTVGGSTSGTGSTGSSSGGASVVAPPASSVAPPVASSSISSESSTSSSEASEIELPSSSSEVSRPTDVEPDEPKEEPAKKSIPLIVPILLVVVTVTIIAVILLAKGGMNIGN